MQRTLPATWHMDPALLWRAAKLLALGGVIFVAAGIAIAGYKGDAYIYWQASHLPADLYSGTWNHDAFSYVYPPIFAQILAPLGLLPYPLFYALWVGLETAALVWLAGPLLAFALILPYEPVQHELLTGNINLMLAAAVVLAVRQSSLGDFMRATPYSPASTQTANRSEYVTNSLLSESRTEKETVSTRASFGMVKAAVRASGVMGIGWSFVLLSKVTPGVGLLWLALRREWHHLGVAVGMTAALVAASFLLAPGLWFEWVGRMAANLAQPANPDELLPLSIRLALALAVVAWGAWKGQRWTMVLAAGLALPNFVPMNLAYFVALIPFLRKDVQPERVGARLRRERVDRS